MAQFHPPEELLVDYASGALRHPWAVLVATHLTLCPACRSEVARLDGVGGSLLDDVAPVATATDAFASLMARIDAGEPEASPAPIVAAPAIGLVPRPLVAYLGMPLEAVPWRSLLPGVQEYALPQGAADRARPALLRIKAGRPVPRHTHEGSEAIVVLSGGFSDDGGHYRRGDVSWADDRHEHRPLADTDGDCVCFTVTDAPLRFTGRFGRVLNLFSRG
jgi:putative transcriptional regulator